MLATVVHLIKNHFAGHPTAPRPTAIEGADQWRLLEFARRHWVSPILYKALIQDRLEAQAEVVTAFQSDYYATARRNVLLLTALEQVLQRMVGSGIEAIVMRGASWAESLYHDIALRPMADVDLLIRPEAIHEVAQVMGGLGYHLRDAVDYCAQFQHGDERTVIEVHWGIGSGSRCFNATVEALWSERQPLHIGNLRTLQLSPEDAVLLTSFHIGFQHCFAARLISFLDLYLLTAGPTARLDWEKLISRAEAFKLSHLVFAVLEVTSRVFSYSLPADVMGRLRAHCTRSQLQRLEAFDPVEKLAGLSQNQAKSPEVPSGASPLTRFFWTYRGKDRWRLLAATLQADDSPITQPPAKSRLMNVLRRVPRLIKTYGRPLAMLGLHRRQAARKPQDTKPPN